MENGQVKFKWKEEEHSIPFPDVDTMLAFQENYDVVREASAEQDATKQLKSIVAGLEALGVDRGIIGKCSAKNQYAELDELSSVVASAIWPEAEAGNAKGGE